ncbi:MAG: class I SAM-dependent methyltransferase [Lachnospiraceae bacterium]|nr:class I SAM-dependent methyltransferase [Lachnospiraceae bacterium]
MQISKRLKAVADMVTSGSILADVGTDHAYIPIYLAERGDIPRAIAMDVNKGPLEKAREHIVQFGLEQEIETRLSDGLAALECGEVQSIVIAGMGGPLTVRILREGREKLSGCRELILQPQSDIKMVRAYIEDKGWQILREEMICEEGKFYPVMKAVPAKVQKKGMEIGGDGENEREKMSPMELRFGPLLLQSRHPVLRDYLLREKRLDDRILEALAGRTGEAAIRKREVEEELELIRQALSLYID